MTGQPFEFAAVDAVAHHSDDSWLSNIIHQGNLKSYFKYIKIDAFPTWDICSRWVTYMQLRTNLLSLPDY